MDTHAFLWFVERDTRLSALAMETIANPSNDLYLSVASIWELSINVSKFKLALNQPFDLFIQQWVLAYTVRELEIQRRHALMAGALDQFHRLGCKFIREVRNEKYLLQTISFSEK